MVYTKQNLFYGENNQEVKTMFFKKIFKKFKRLRYCSKENAIYFNLKKEVALDVSGRLREDAMMWGVTTHKMFFKILLDNVVMSGFFYEPLRGADSLPSISDKAYDELMNIKFKYYTVPVSIVLALLVFLFFI